MVRLAFVTPAHGRVGLASLCLEQRAQVCAELQARGVQATCVVVADDRNLDLAAERGFHTIRIGNEVLGAKWNAGIEWACREWRADVVVPIGSDDWVLADYMAVLPEPGEVRASRSLGLVRPDGGQIVAFEAHAHDGFIPWLIPAALLARCEFRPVPDDMQYGFDGAIADRLWAVDGVVWQQTHVSDLQIVDFKSPSQQLTGYDRTVQANPVAWHDQDPWTRLADVYPAGLVERMEAFYKARNRVRNP